MFPKYQRLELKERGLVYLQVFVQTKRAMTAAPTTPATPTEYWVGAELPDDVVDEPAEEAAVVPVVREVVVRVALVAAVVAVVVPAVETVVVAAAVVLVPALVAAEEVAETEPELAPLEEFKQLVFPPVVTVTIPVWKMAPVEVRMLKTRRVLAGSVTV
jgi:hypothetical protein